MILPMISYEIRLAFYEYSYRRSFTRQLSIRVLSILLNQFVLTLFSRAIGNICLDVIFERLSQMKQLN